MCIILVIKLDLFGGLIKLAKIREIQKKNLHFLDPFWKFVFQYSMVLKIWSQSKCPNVYVTIAGTPSKTALAQVHVSRLLDCTAKLSRFHNFRLRKKIFLTKKVINFIAKKYILIAEKYEMIADFWSPKSCYLLIK